jgi:hypothetical protein
MHDQTYSGTTAWLFELRNLQISPQWAASVGDINHFGKFVATRMILTIGIIGCHVKSLMDRAR